MSSWKGKTRGGLLGHQLFVFFLKYTGIKFSYFILRFVAFYFLLFSRESNRYSRYYYRIILHYNPVKSILSMYRNYYIFGQTILDKVALMAGFTKSFTCDFNGEHHLAAMVENQTGGILISAHVGNWEIAGHLLQRLKTTINIVMYDGEYQQIKTYLGDVMGERKVKIIPVKNDISHIILIGNALRNKEIICMHADRFVAGSKVISTTFMGEEAPFPAGPFTIATRFQVPVSFVFAMKESTLHYQLSATAGRIYHTDEKAALQDYIHALEKQLKKYPDQWFNYYRFWNNAA